jgi:hypothetical protein
MLLYQANNHIRNLVNKQQCHLSVGGYDRMKIFSTKILAFTFCLAFLLFSSPVQAQQEGGKPIYGDPMQDITLVGACTVGGAVLGLSTLPFTEEPGDHLKNILVGGAIGLIIGVALVAYVQANKTNTYYGAGLSVEAENLVGFSTQDRIQYHQPKNDNQLSTVNYSFSF